MLGRRTERSGPAGQSGTDPCAARGSGERALPGVPLGGAELPTCRPGARWRVLVRKGEGSANWGRPSGFGLEGSLEARVEER